MKTSNTILHGKNCISFERFVTENLKNGFLKNIKFGFTTVCQTGNLIHTTVCQTDVLLHTTVCQTGNLLHTTVCQTGDLLHTTVCQNLGELMNPVPYFGGHGAKQYMKGKPTKFGYKIWTAATRLGYVIQFQPYQGAGTMQQDKNLGMSGSVVKELVSVLPCPSDCTYHIVFDNFFTSMSLLTYLHEQGYAATGTLRANRLCGAPLPDIKIIEKKDRGYYRCVSEEKNKITVCRWRDNKAVTVASTYCGSTPESSASRYCRDEGGKIALPMPKMIAEYNFGMDGVDRFD